MQIGRILPARTAKCDLYKEWLNTIKVYRRSAGLQERLLCVETRLRYEAYYLFSAREHAKGRSCKICSREVWTLNVFEGWSCVLKYE